MKNKKREINTKRIKIYFKNKKKDLRNKILIAINKGLNEALDLDDFDEKKSLRTSILNSNIENKKLYYQNLIDSLFNSNIYQNALLLYLEYGIKYNPVKYNINLQKLILNSLMGGIYNLNWIDTSEVTDMSNLFSCEEYPKKLQNVFNKIDISDWDVSNVKDMSWMFKGIEDDEGNWEYNNFNGDISKWDVSNVKDISYIFYISLFNRDISNWNVSNVTNMLGMFMNSIFNGDISNWDVSHVTDMSSMFQYSKFNKDISNWDVSHVKNMEKMFKENYYFNGDISKWNVSNVTDMYCMFGGYDADVEEMRGECEYTVFNGDISNWNVSNVTNMNDMFHYSNFEGDISNWKLNNNCLVYDMFELSAKTINEHNEMIQKMLDNKNITLNQYKELKF